MWVWSLGHEDPLEKEMATHSSILGWKVPWMEGPGGLQSTGSQRVGHNWVTSLCKSIFNFWLPFLDLSELFEQRCYGKLDFQSCRQHTSVLSSFFFFFWTWLFSFWELSPQQHIGLGPHTVKVCSPNHWKAREFAVFLSLQTFSHDRLESIKRSVYFFCWMCLLLPLHFAQ